MALYNKAGFLLKQSVSATSALNGQSSMLSAIRCMSTQLFIGGLSYRTDDQGLRDAFECFGDVIDARVVTDRVTGRSRGFGFVNFTSDESASSALSSMDGQVLDERSIRVSYANERLPRSSFGNAGGFGGGFGRSRANEGF